MIALIAVSAAIYAIDKPYSYLVPPDLELSPGMRVMVPFGPGNRRTEGMVLDVQKGEPEGLKPIYSVLDAEPVLTLAFLRMAAFLRERYFCTYYDALKAILPAGLWFDREETLFLLEEPDSPRSLDKQPEAQLVAQFLRDRGGKCLLADLRTGLSGREEELERGLSYLKKKKYLCSNLDYTQKIQDKTEKIISLAVPAEQAMALAQKKQRSAPVQYEVLKLLCAVGSAGSKELCYLTGASSSTLRRLEGLGLVESSQREVFRSSLPEFVEPAGPVVLNDEQQQVYDGLSAQLRQEKPGAALLYGVTGSGKTSVYLKLIRQTLDEGGSAILMVPEIALTPQLLQTLMSHFGKTVAVLHSALRVSERYDAWKRIRNGDARVVIGTRSAVFAPVQSLRLLILDEEQEHTYKSENSPRYHAREVALYRGAKERALVLLGSATPSVETMYLAKTGVYTLYCLTRRYNGRALPAVEIVDMKQELRRGNGESLSLPLREAMEQAHADGKQTILFLNRRGAGHCMICVSCGSVPHCPRCSVSLTYHRVNNRLMCHYCGFSVPVPEQCPECGGPMKIVGTGTQKIEQELLEHDPRLPLLRMDADTISASNSHEAILERFRRENIPVLIGTQMVTKGLNFENVILVGVVDADMSLYLNHYRAAETTFSMLTQVIGRSGRGRHAGKAIIQTMTPEHSVIQLAARQDYDSFYELELTMRQLQCCPPFADLFTITFAGSMESNVSSAAFRCKAELEARLAAPEYAGLPLQLLGPSPAAVAKVNNTFRYRMTLRCENSRTIRLLLSQLLKDFAKERKNKGVFAFADINSYE